MGSRTLSALSGNDSLKKIAIGGSSKEVMSSLIQSLPGNMGIEHLAIRDYFMKDETWSLVFHSLATHPRINFLSVPCRILVSGSFQPLSAESKTTRMNAILQMLHLNTVVHTISLPD
jgi:hypothetical protein